MTADELRERIEAALRERHGADARVDVLRTERGWFATARTIVTLDDSRRSEHVGPTYLAPYAAIEALALACGLYSDGTDPRVALDRLTRELAERDATIAAASEKRQNDKRVDELKAQLYAAESERDALLYGRSEPPTAAEVLRHEAEDGISEWLHRCGSHGDIVHVEVVDGEVIDMDLRAPPCNRGRWWALSNGVCMGLRPTSAPSEWIASLRERAEKAERERDAALAVIAGSAVAPTDAELEAHREAGGAWVLVFTDDSFSLIRSSLGLIRHHRDAGRVKTWFSIDENGRPCLRTPVAMEAK